MIYTTIKEVHDEWQRAKRYENDARERMSEYLKEVVREVGMVTVKIADKFYMIGIQKKKKDDENTRVVLYETIGKPMDANMYSAEFMLKVCDAVRELRLVEEWREDEWDKKEGGENNNQ